MRSTTKWFQLLLNQTTDQPTNHATIWRKWSIKIDFQFPRKEIPMFHKFNILCNSFVLLDLFEFELLKITLWTSGILNQLFDFNIFAPPPLMWRWYANEIRNSIEYIGIFSHSKMWTTPCRFIWIEDNDMNAFHSLQHSILVDKCSEERKKKYVQKGNTILT